MAGNPSKIAVALAQLCPGRDFNSFLRDPKFSSRNPKTCIWVDVCDIVQPSRHVITLRKNIQKCYNTFQNKFQQIKTVYEKLDYIGESTASDYTRDKDVNNNSSVRPLSSNGYEEDAVFPDGKNDFEDEKTTACGSTEEKTTLCVIAQEKTDHVRSENNNTLKADCAIENWTGNFDDLSSTEDESSSRFSTVYIEQHADDTLNDVDIAKTKEEVTPHAPNVDQHTKDSSAHSALQHNEDTATKAASHIICNDDKSDRAASSGELCSSESSLSDISSVKIKRSEHGVYTADEGLVIPKEFWMKYWSGERQLRKGWADSFVQYVKSIERYKYCVFKVNYHRCYKAQKNVKVYFYASMQCKNSSCTAYKFEVHEAITMPFKDIEIEVFRNKAIEHDGSEIHRRFIRGAQRDRYGNLLQIDKPSVVRSKKIQEISLDVLESGNRDEAPSLTILQKISSENETKQDLDRDPLVHLQKRAELYRRDPKWFGSPVAGYIQDLFSCIAFTEKQILHLLSLLPKNKVFCYLDATGKIVSVLPYSDKRMFYYALVLPGCARLDHEYGPMPLAEFLSNTHTVPQITYFLSTVNHAIKMYTTRKLVITKIETDFSIALIASVLKSFNDMTISRYLNALYVLVITGSHQLPGFTLVHVCSSHMLKTIQRKCKEIFCTRDQHNFAAVLVTKLIHAETMAAAAEAFKMVTVVFGLPYKVPVLKSYVDEINLTLRKETKERKKKGNKRATTTQDENEKLIHEKKEKLTKEKKKKKIEGNTTNEKEEKPRKGEKEAEPTKIEEEEGLTKDMKDQVDDEEDDPADIELKYDVELFDEADSGRKDSPFYKYFKTTYDTVQNEMTKHPGSDKNEWYCDEFLKYLLLYILPYYPLWSAVIITQLNLLRDSNATVENYFKIIKNLVLQKRLNISAPRFFLKVEQLLEGWLRERHYPLVTNRQKVGRVKRNMAESVHVDENLATEEFKKDPPKRRKGNIYFPQSKYVLNEAHSSTSTIGQPTNYEIQVKNPVEIQRECPRERILEETISRDDYEQAAAPKDQDSTVIDIENIEESGNFNGRFDQDLDTRFLIEMPYPPNFPHYRKNVGGFELNPALFARLLPDIWLDGEIINSFFFDLQEIADSNSWSLLTFDTYFSTKILKGENSIGFTNWAKKVQPLKFDIWLLPVLVNDCHWTLLVVMLTHRVMVYFDSCHGLPPKILIDRLCSFIASSRSARRAKLTQWKSWQFSAPIDTPAQTNDLGETTGNCGVHVCLWAYAIVSRSYACFKEKDMNGARRGIAKLLIEFPNTKKKNDERIATGQSLFESYDSVPEVKNMLSVIPVTRSPPLGFESTSHFVATIKTLIEIAKE